MSKLNDSFKLLEKLEQENEEEWSLGWRMKLIYLSLMTQRLKNTRNKLGWRRSTTELHSLKFEFVQNERTKAPKDFLSQRPISYDVGLNWQGFVTLEWPPWLPFWTCQSIPKMGSFVFFSKTSKSYLNRQGYSTNLPRNMCIQSDPHTMNTLKQS